MKRSFRLYILLLAVSIAIMVLISCSDNSVNSGDATANKLNVQISMVSQGMLDIVTSFQLTIIAEGRNPMVVPLEYKHGVISGTIENAPAGNNVVFLVQGMDADGVVIYSGSETLRIVADQENQIEINLSPVVSMIKISPRYLQISPGETSTVDIKVYNLSNLNQISFRLYSLNSRYDPAPDSVALSPRLLELGDNLIFFDSFSVKPSFYTMAFANGGTENMVNDPNGDITLATLYYSADAQEILPDSTIIIFDSLTIYDIIGNLIPSSSVIHDQCFVMITESGDSIVTFPDPNLEQAIRNATEISTRDIWLSDLRYIYYFDANSMNIVNLSGLEVLENLEQLYLGGNEVSDISALEDLSNLYYLDLSNNIISDIQPLVDNDGINAEDYIDLRGNPLDVNTIEINIPVLVQRGVTVVYDN